MQLKGVIRRRGMPRRTDAGNQKNISNNLKAVLLFINTVAAANKQP
jgi:hypothetical protein